MWQLHAACNLWGNLSISVTSFEIFDNNCCRTWNSGRVNLVTWRLSLTNSCKKSLINICNKILINSCNESLTNRCNTSLIQIASFHSILLAIFSSRRWNDKCFCKLCVGRINKFLPQKDEIQSVPLAQISHFKIRILNINCLIGTCKCVSLSS